MTIYINNQKPVVHKPVAICDTFETLEKFASALPCIFISAYNGSEESEKLSNAIIKSDLTYIKCQNGILEAFCVVNNGYTNDDFVKLGIEWCRKYECKSVLITFPKREKINQRRLISICGKAYNSKGQLKETVEFSVPFKDTCECFARVFGKHVALDGKSEIVETDLTPPQTISGRRMAHARFILKYPSFCTAKEYEQYIFDYYESINS